MKCRIRYRKYRNTYEGTLEESILAVEARFFKIENGFVVIWLKDSETSTPDLYINVNDVFTIEPL